MEVNKGDLIKALRAVLPGVSSGNVLLTGADSFVFRGGTVQSYNDHLAVTYPFDIGIDADELVSVKAAEMVQVVERMSGQELELSLKGPKLFVTDGKTSLSMKRKEDIDVPRLLEALALEDLDWDELPGDLVGALELCLPSVSRDHVHGALVGINIRGQNVMSSDNFRITWVRLAESMPEFTLPGSAVADLLKIGELERYAVTGSWAHFLTVEGAVFSSKLIASEYPYDGLMGLFPDKSDQVYVLPKGLENTIKRVSPLAYQRESGDDFINLRAVGDNKLAVTGEREDAGSAVEEVDLGEGGWPEGVEINIQPNYLLDILKKTREFSVVGGLVHFEADNFKHVIATIAVEE